MHQRRHVHHVLSPFLAFDTSGLPIRVPACNASQEVHLEGDGSTVGPGDHVGQKRVKAFQTVAPSHCAVPCKAHTITGHILCDGVHVPPRWILDTFQVLLLVLPDVLDGRSILEQMQLVLIHPSCSLQDLKGTLDTHTGFLGTDCDPPDIMAQI